MDGLVAKDDDVVAGGVAVGYEHERVAAAKPSAHEQPVVLRSNERDAAVGRGEVRVAGV